MDKTKYSARWCKTSRDGSEGECLALFSSDVPFETLKDFVDSLWTQEWEETRWIDILDMETGEIIYQRDNWDSFDDCDDSGYEDCGFDPYMGCYTDDY